MPVFYIIYWGIHTSETGFLFDDISEQETNSNALGMFQNRHLL